MKCLPLFPDGSLRAKFVCLVRKLAVGVENYVLLWNGTIDWEGSPGYFCLAGVVAVGISLLFIVLRTPPCGSLDEVALPVQIPTTGPSATPLSLEEAFWIAVQAG